MQLEEEAAATEPPSTCALGHQPHSTAHKAGLALRPFLPLCDPLTPLVVGRQGPGARRCPEGGRAEEVRGFPALSLFSPGHREAAAPLSSFPGLPALGPASPPRIRWQRRLGGPLPAWVLAGGRRFRCLSQASSATWWLQAPRTPRATRPSPGISWRGAGAGGQPGRCWPKITGSSKGPGILPGPRPECAPHRHVCGIRRCQDGPTNPEG